mmetsp:Transcript_49682/g.97906  ORF Transcript_49682/g.97906 Transcript_49682/m.97906 type:complete len:338 (-) Transcript_49682:1314-2327(-)
MQRLLLSRALLVVSEDVEVALEQSLGQGQHPLAQPEREHLQTPAQVALEVRDLCRSLVGELECPLESLQQRHPQPVHVLNRGGTGLGDHSGEGRVGCCPQVAFLCVVSAGGLHQPLADVREEWVQGGRGEGLGSFIERVVDCQCVDDPADVGSNARLLLQSLQQSSDEALALHSHGVCRRLCSTGRCNLCLCGCCEHLVQNSRVVLSNPTDRPRTRVLHCHVGVPQSRQNVREGLINQRPQDFLRGTLHDGSICQQSSLPLPPVLVSKVQIHILKHRLHHCVPNRLCDQGQTHPASHREGPLSFLLLGLVLFVESVEKDREEERECLSGEFLTHGCR